MNDRQVFDLWKALDRLMKRLVAVEMKVETMDARIRARLKEDAENAKMREFVNGLFGTIDIKEALPKGVDDTLGP